MDLFQELDSINSRAEEQEFINEDRHFDETLVNKRRCKVEFKKGDYVYYVKLSGDTYPTQIIKVGRSGRLINRVLIELQTFKSDRFYKRWVNKSRVRLQDEDV